MKKILQRIILAIVLVLFVIYFAKNKEDFFSITDINVQYIIIIMILRCFQIFLNGIFLKVIIDPIITQKIPIKTAFYISSFSAVGNFLSFLQGGVVARGVYLNQQYGLSYSKFTGSVIYNYAIFFFVFGMLGFISLLFLDSITYITLSVFLFSFSGIGIFLFWVQLRDFTKFKVFDKPKFKNISSGIQDTKQAYKSIKLLSTTITLTLLRFIIAILINLLIFASINKSINSLGLILYTSITGLSVIINITPASIGFREGLLMIFKDSMMLTNLDVVEISIIDRVLLVIVLFILFLVTRAHQKK